MRKLLFILLSALSLTAFAQQKVAVYVTGQETGINKVLGDKLVAAFAKSGKYIAIERTASFLAELSKEQTYQRTGAVDDNELSRLGKQFGVQLVCVADVSDVFGEKYVSARLIDVESAEVVNTANTSSQMHSMTELLSVTDKITKELTSKTVYERAAEAAALKKAEEDKEKMLLEGFANGYIKCGNLYAIISYSQVTGGQRNDIASSCRVGGYDDWRIPNVSELNVVKQVCRNLYYNKENYPKISTGQMEQLKKIFDGDSFWVTNSYIIRKNGSSISYSDSSISTKDTFGLILVRDAK